MYELAETANQELKARGESQQAYIHRLSRGEFIPPPPVRPQRSEWKIKETITADRIRTNNIIT